MIQIYSFVEREREKARKRKNRDGGEREDVGVSNYYEDSKLQENF